MTIILVVAALITCAIANLYLNETAVTDDDRNDPYSANIAVDTNPTYGTAITMKMDANPANGTATDNTIRMDNNPVYGIGPTIKLNATPGPAYASFTTTIGTLV